MLVAIACQHKPAASPAECPYTTDECTLRASLGIPADAHSVIVFGQSSHLDIDWQKTFDDYYSTYVEADLLAARQLMDADPRNYYSIAEMAYLQHHVEVHPEELPALQADVANGKLHIVGGGMTSPDTLLAETELLTRDLLYGSMFAEDTLGAHPTAAWLPDSFGQSGTAPDMLAAAGYQSVAFSRIDGGQTVLEQINHPDDPPPDGSTVAALLAAGSADFVWQGTGGGSVLAHYMAAPRLYCQGDNIDYNEIMEMPGGHIGPKDDSADFTDSRIDQYIGELTPWSPDLAPDEGGLHLMFVPIGCDFEPANEQLLAYLDGYNERQYPASGVWAVAAPFDDYAALVAPHEDALPTVTGELSPYFMGFYGTRADIKRRVREATRPFLTAEAFATVLTDGADIVKAAAPEFSLLTRADHHDFITGTSTDDVAKNEQMPLLDEAEAAGNAELQQVVDELASRIPVMDGAVGRVLVLNATSGTQSGVVQFSVPLVDGAAPTLDLVSSTDQVWPMELAGTDGVNATFRAEVSVYGYGWSTFDLLPYAAPNLDPGVSLDLLDADGNAVSAALATRVVLRSHRVSVAFDRDDATGAFSMTSLDDGAEQLAGPSFTLQTYDDQGGLWRLGNEMDGCALTPRALVASADTVSVLTDSALEVGVAFTSTDGDVREVRLDADAGYVDFALTLSADEGTTRTAAFALADVADPLQTSSPGGYVERAAQRVYDPTFWPAVAWTRVGTFGLLLRQSTGVRMSTPGQIELLAARDARQEQCDMEGGTGTDTGAHRIEWRFQTEAEPGDEEIAAQQFDRPLDAHVVTTAPSTPQDLPEAAGVAGAGMQGVVTALKPAERGAGAILRVQVQGATTVDLPAGTTTATRTDLVERDIAPLTVTDGTVTLDPADGALQTIRVQ